MGGYGIVGGNLPIAAGLALASQYKGEDAVTVCMFGDGASNTGNFGETMNLAALWKLPVLFLVENNLYGMGTAVERHSAQTDLSKKAEGYGIPGTRVDGMDVVAVREGVAEGLRAAREESRPTLLEAFTYRYRGHSAADPEVYREREEVEEWREKDPIETFARRCVEAGVLGEREVQQARDGGRGRRSSRRSSSPRPRRSRRSTRCTKTSTRSTDPGGWYAVDERSPEPHRGEHEDTMPDAGPRAGRGRRRLRRAVEDEGRGPTRRSRATRRTAPRAASASRGRTAIEPQDQGERPVNAEEDEG